MSYGTLRDEMDRTQETGRNDFHHGMAVIDLIYTGNDQAVEITGLSCKVVLGSEPTLCPDADPLLPPTMLSEVPRAIQRLTPLPDGLTIHWVGHNAGRRNCCRCHPDAPSAAPADRERWPVPVVRPEWDRPNRRLRYRGAVIRDYSRKSAKNQERLLDAFQDAGWETTVMSPFEGRVLKEALHAFNTSVTPDTIRLRADGTAKGASWSPLNPDGSTRA